MDAQKQQHDQRRSHISTQSVEEAIKNRSEEAEVELNYLIGEGTEPLDRMMMAAAEVATGEPADEPNNERTKGSQTVEQLFEGSEDLLPEVEMDHPEGRESASRQTSEPARADSRSTSRRASSLICSDLDYQEAQNLTEDEIHRYFQAADNSFDYPNFGDTANFQFPDFDSTLPSLEQYQDTSGISKSADSQSQQPQECDPQKEPNWLRQSSQTSNVIKHGMLFSSTLESYQQPPEPQQALPADCNNNTLPLESVQVSGQVKPQECLNGSAPRERIISQERNSNCIATTTSGSTIHYKVREQEEEEDQHQQQGQYGQMEVNNNSLPIYDQSYIYNGAYEGGQQYARGHYGHKFQYDSHHQIQYHPSHDSGYASFATLGSNYNHQAGYYQHQGQHQLPNQYHEHYNQGIYQQQHMEANYEVEGGKTYHVLGQNNTSSGPAQLQGLPGEQQTGSIYASQSHYDAGYKQNYSQIIHHQDQQQHPTTANYYTSYEHNGQQQVHPAESNKTTIVDNQYDPTAEFDGLLMQLESTSGRHDDCEDDDESADNKVDEELTENEDQDDDESGSNDNTRRAAGLRSGRAWSATGAKGCRSETLHKLRTFLLKRIQLKSRSGYSGCSLVSSSSTTSTASSSFYSSGELTFERSTAKPYNLDTSNKWQSSSALSADHNDTLNTDCEVDLSREPSPHASGSQRIYMEASNTGSDSGELTSLATASNRSHHKQQEPVLMSNDGRVLVKQVGQQERENEMQLRSRTIIIPARHARRISQARRSDSSSSTYSTSSRVSAMVESRMQSSRQALARGRNEEGSDEEEGGEEEEEEEEDDDDDDDEDEAITFGVQTRSSKRRRNHDASPNLISNSSLSASPASCSSV